MQKLKNKITFPLTCLVMKIKCLIFTPKQSFENNVDLLLISITKYSYYNLIKYCNIFMTNKTKHHEKKTFLFSILHIR